MPAAAPGLLFRPQQVADVGAVEAGQEHPSLLEGQALDDLSAGAGIGGGGQGQPGNLRELLGQGLQLQVLGAEVVAPLRDAVGLVDGEQGQGPLLQPLEQIAGEQALR